MTREQLSNVLQSSIDAAKGRIEKFKDEINLGEAKALLEKVFEVACISAEKKHSLESVYNLIEECVEERRGCKQSVVLGPKGNARGSIRNMVELSGDEVLEKELRGVASAAYQFCILNLRQVPKVTCIKVVRSKRRHISLVAI